MRILVTGGAGFIGSHLVDLLVARGHRVIGLDNLVTGNERNLAPFRDNDAFTFIECDVSRRIVGGSKTTESCLMTFVSESYSRLDEATHDLA